MNYFLKCFKYFTHTLVNFSNLSSRASRKELFIYILFSLLIMSAIPATFLVFIVPFFSLLVRRTKDLDITPFTLLLLMIPVISTPIMLYLLLAKGDEGKNKYGSPMKYFWDLKGKFVNKEKNKQLKSSKTTSVENVRVEKEKEIEFDF